MRSCAECEHDTTSTPTATRGLFHGQQHMLLSGLKFFSLFKTISTTVTMTTISNISTYNKLEILVNLDHDQLLFPAPFASDLSELNGQ